MLLKQCFPLKHHKTNEISSIRQVAVGISQSRKNALSRRDKTISKTKSERNEAIPTCTYGIFAKSPQRFQNDVFWSEMMIKSKVH